MKGEFKPHFRAFFGTNWVKSARDYDPYWHQKLAYCESRTQNLDNQIAKLCDLHGRFSVKNEKIKRRCSGCAGVGAPKIAMRSLRSKACTAIRFANLLRLDTLVAK